MSGAKFILVCLLFCTANVQAQCVKELTVGPDDYLLVGDQVYCNETLSCEVVAESDTSMAFYFNGELRDRRLNWKYIVRSGDLKKYSPSPYFQSLVTKGVSGKEAVRRCRKAEQRMHWDLNILYTKSEKLNETDEFFQSFKVDRPLFPLLIEEAKCVDGIPLIKYYSSFIFYRLNKNHDPAMEPIDRWQDSYNNACSLFDRLNEYFQKDKPYFGVVVLSTKLAGVDYSGGETREVAFELLNEKKNEWRAKRN